MTVSLAMRLIVRPLAKYVKRLACLFFVSGGPGPLHAGPLHAFARPRWDCRASILDIPRVRIRGGGSMANVTVALVVRDLTEARLDVLQWTDIQAAVHPALQSCGIGTLLVGDAERRIRARGLA